MQISNWYEEESQAQSVCAMSAIPAVAKGLAILVDALFKFLDGNAPPDHPSKAAQH